MSKKETGLLIALCASMVLCALLIGFIIGNNTDKTPAPEEETEQTEPVAPTLPEEPTTPPEKPQEPTTEPEGENMKPEQNPDTEPTEGPHKVVIPDYAKPGDEGDVMAEDQVIVDLSTMPAIDTKYTTASVLNIRSAPGTEYDVLDAVVKGTKMEILNIYGDWSLVRYSNATKFGYAFNEYLSDTGAQDGGTAPSDKEAGNIGRLYIPALGIDVGLNTPYNQDTVDRQDSAAYIGIDGTWVQGRIADHVNQAFGNLGNAVPGQTTMTIDYGDRKDEYKCVDNFLGYNLGTEMTNENGETIRTMNEGGFCVYTCTSGGKVRITLWHK